jgi:hypothetical protein
VRTPGSLGREVFTDTALAKLAKPCPSAPPAVASPSLANNAKTGAPTVLVVPERSRDGPPRYQPYRSFLRCLLIVHASILTQEPSEAQHELGAAYHSPPSSRTPPRVAWTPPRARGGDRERSAAGVRGSRPSQNAKDGVPTVFAMSARSKDRLPRQQGASSIDHLSNLPASQ